LAVLLEIVDTIIVYMIRGTKKREEKEEKEKKEDNVVPPNISIDNNKKIVNVR